MSFHSIGIPSEWGRKLLVFVNNPDNQEFPFNWDPQRVGTRDNLPWTDFTQWSFHSIGIPSEWGHHV